MTRGCDQVGPSRLPTASVFLKVVLPFHDPAASSGRVGEAEVSSQMYAISSIASGVRGEEL